MASDQRFQRTVQAVAEAVQVFAAGTFDFAESIKQIWGPQAQPDALETSNLLPIEGMQDVQIVGQLRERIPVSQDGDQLAIHSHTYPPSVTLHNGEGVSEVSHETTVPVETANMELSNNLDVLAGSIHRSIRSCYECFARWRDESPFPPCHSSPGQQTCNYCLRNQIPCDMIPAGEMGKMLQRRREADLYLPAQSGNVPVKREPFEHPFYETSEHLEMPLSSPIADTLQQQAGSKRVYQDIDEQQPVAKRQQTRGLRHKLMPKSCGGERFMRQEQDGHGATGDGESSSSSVSSSSSLEEEGLEMGTNRQESWPIKISDLLRVPEKVTHELEEEIDVSSSSTQGRSLAESSSEEEDHGYSSEEEEQAVQIPAVRSREENSESSSSSLEDESSEEDSDDEPGEPKQQLIAKEELLKELKENSEEPIQLPDNESSNSSSEDGSSDEESEHKPEEQQKIQLAPEAFLQEKRREIMMRMKEAITNVEEDISVSESSSSSSDDESSEEESDDEPEEPTKQPGTKEQSPKEPIQPSDDQWSDSSSEDESSEEESEEKPEQPKKQLATKVEPQKSREEKPEESIEITSDESSLLSDDEFSEEDSDMEI